MSALTDNRKTETRSGEYIEPTIATGSYVYAGSLVALNASGEAVPATDTTGLTVIGVSQQEKEAGERVKVRRIGAYKLANDASLDDTHVGKTCYAIDDQTVGETSTNSIAAGTVIQVEDDGVWVELQ